jgi:hypothetical protein
MHIMEDHPESADFHNMLANNQSGIHSPGILNEENQFDEMHGDMTNMPMNL